MKNKQKCQIIIFFMHFPYFHSIIIIIQYILIGAAISCERYDACGITVLAVAQPVWIRQGSYMTMKFELRICRDDSSHLCVNFYPTPTI
jgi:hypothetical protein